MDAKLCGASAMKERVVPTYVSAPRDLHGELIDINDGDRLVTHTHTYTYIYIYIYIMQVIFVYLSIHSDTATKIRRQ